MTQLSGQQKATTTTTKAIEVNSSALNEPYLLNVKLSDVSAYNPMRNHYLPTLSSISCIVKFKMYFSKNISLHVKE